MPKPTPEDNFRIEVWDAEEKERLETISRSPDFAVSVAAWQAALRRRPGRLLVHHNANHVINRVHGIGELATVTEATDARLSDLAGWHRLRAWCHGCSHHADIEQGRLKRRFAADATFSTIERKLRCSKCGRGPASLQIFKLPRG